MKTKEIYICNGRQFGSMDEVDNYCAAAGLRITNTETIRKNTYLITVTSVNPINVYESLEVR